MPLLFIMAAIMLVKKFPDVNTQIWEIPGRVRVPLDKILESRKMVESATQFADDFSISCVKESLEISDSQLAI